MRLLVSHEYLVIAHWRPATKVWIVKVRMDVELILIVRERHV